MGRRHTSLEKSQRGEIVGKGWRVKREERGMSNVVNGGVLFLPEYQGECVNGMNNLKDRRKNKAS